jgi:CopG family transcriptional regulator, nickel-responsive regulator
MSNQFSSVIFMSLVTSISLSAKLRNKLDEIKDQKDYSSRSEVIRDAIRTYLSEYEISKLEKGNLTATITAMYQKSGPHLDDVLLHLRHEYDDIVEGNLHLHVGGGDNCAEIFVTEGNAERVSNFIGKIRAIRGIEQVKYSIVPLP